MSNKVIQNIFSTYADYLNKSAQPLKNRKAIYALTHCRTREMGVSYYSCSENHKGIEQFHSCRHRSCFLCAQKKRLEWIESQKNRLLNIPHFHVIFTLPHEYLSTWRYNESLFTRIIFQASQNTLLELMADKKYGGITPGILMALHTWGRQLTLHPHTHCLVTAGGLTSNGEWADTGVFLLPSGVIRKVYRGKLQSLLRDYLLQGELKLPPEMSESDFWRMHRSLYKKEWSVRIEERYEHGKGVLLYLARYCKGGPVNPKQIDVSCRRSVEMRYLDHRDKRTKALSLKHEEFLRRILEHVPPSGIHTIRYYGVYAPASKEKHLSCVAKHGTLEGVKASSGSQIQSMLLYCKTCGRPSTLSYQLWSRVPKGISINRESSSVYRRFCTTNGDQADLTKGSLYNTS